MQTLGLVICYLLPIWIFGYAMFLYEKFSWQNTGIAAALFIQIIYFYGFCFSIDNKCVSLGILGSAVAFGVLLNKDGFDRA